MTARTGMADIISEVRTLTQTGAADYTLGTVTYWTDEQLQNILDRHALEYDAVPMLMVPTRMQGGFSYTDYYIGKGWIEQEVGGTAIFKITDINGATMGTALYSVDYNVGEVTFAADQGGAIPYMVTCTSYDVNAVAAEVWRKKAGHFGTNADYDAPSRKQLYEHAIANSDNFLSMSNEGASNISLERADDPSW
jgi:hypothetical protein